MADANSYTLADLALNSNDPMIRKISMSLIMNGNVMQDLPIENYASFKANGLRWQGANALPTVAWRALNQDPATTKGTPTPFEEQAYTLSNNIDIDSKLLRDVNAIQNPFAQQISAYLKAATYDFNDKFINNAPITGDENAIVGLRTRMDNPTIYGIETEMKIDAAVDLSASPITSANANKFLEALQQALDFMGNPEGDGVVFYGNDLVLRKITSAVRILGAGGGFRFDQDAFDRTVTKYRNASFRDLGRKADQSTRIIPTTETNTGASGGTQYTSLYGVHFAMEDAFKAWNFDSLEQSVIGPFLLQNGVQQRVTIDWTVGLFQENTRAVSRLYDIKVA
jgi:hypothetical protein